MDQCREKRDDRRICCKVLPKFTLLMMEYMLNPGGYIVCTTPNAARLVKKIKPLFGRNVQEKIRFYSLNPGHYREYTGDELMEMANKTNLKAVKHMYIDYDFKGNIIRGIIRKIISLVPSWREYQIMVYGKHIPR